MSVTPEAAQTVVPKGKTGDAVATGVTANGLVSPTLAAKGFAVLTSPAPNAVPRWLPATGSR